MWSPMRLSSSYFQVKLAAADFFAEIDRFEHRAIAVAAAANVINFARARRANKRGEGVHQIGAVNVVAHLFALVTEDAIRPPGDGADHQVGQKPVQLRAGVRRPVRQPPRKQTVGIPK